MTAEVELLFAQHLPKKDTFGSIDPYVEATVGQKMLKSQVIKNDLTPHWDEKMAFENVQMGQPLVLKLFDWDRMSKNDLVGECTVPLGQMNQEVNLPLSLDGKPVIGKDKSQAEITIKCKMLGGAAPPPPAPMAPPAPTLVPPPPAPSPPTATAANTKKHAMASVFEKEPAPSGDKPVGSLKDRIAAYKNAAKD